MAKLNESSGCLVVLDTQRTSLLDQIIKMPLDILVLNNREDFHENYWKYLQHSRKNLTKKAKIVSLVKTKNNQQQTDLKGLHLRLAAFARGEG